MGRRPALRRLLALALLGLALLLPGAAEAARDLYRVAGIPVDATADDAVAARAIALERGEREGLALLLRRLTLAESAGALPDVGRLDIQRFVRSFEITAEQVAPTRYVASLNVTYDPGAVESLLAAEGIPAVTRPPPPVLLVPALGRDGGVDLWGEDNPWRAAWDTPAVENTLVEIVLPLGDLADVSTLRPGDLAAGDAAAADGLAARYGTEDVVVATLDGLPPGADPPPPELRLDVRRLSGDRAQLLAEALPVPAGATAADALTTAVTRVTRAVDEDWKRRNLVPAGRTASLIVEVPLADLAGWIQIRHDLEGLPVVRRVRVEALERTMATVIIEYVGELWQLESALGGLGLILSQESDSWRLLPAGAPRDRATPSPVTGRAL